MRKKINPVLIGAFVVLAAIVAGASVLYFGVNKYTGEYDTNVAFFRIQTHGLDVGAPVVLQGVKVGNVTKINVGYTAKQKSFYVRVEFVTNNAAISWSKENNEFYDGESSEYLQNMIALGLRVRLASQSLVTGKLMLELGFFPSTVVVLQGTEENEIPTTFNSVQRLWKELEKIDVRSIVHSIQNTAQGLDQLIADINPKKIEKELFAVLQEITAMVADSRKTLGHLDSKVDPIAKSILTASNNIAHLSKNLDEQITPLSADLREALSSMSVAMQSADKALTEVQVAMDERSPLQIEVVKAMKNISEAARSLRDFTDYLERHPEALLTGKRQ